MATATKEFAIITTTELYGPKTEHSIQCGDRDEPQVFDSLDAARAAMPEQSGPMYLGHNEASVSTDVWEVVSYIDPNDWCGWPADLEDAARAVLADIGKDFDEVDADDVDIDLPVEAAQRLGMAMVESPEYGHCLLCKPIDD